MTKRDPGKFKRRKQVGLLGVGAVSASPRWAGFSACGGQ